MESVVSKSRQIKNDVTRMYSVASINLGMGIYSGLRAFGALAFGGASGDSSYIDAEGVHDIGDTSVYLARAYTFSKDPTAKDYNKKFRFITYSIVGGLATALCVKTGIDLVSNVNNFQSDEFFTNESLQNRAYKLGDSMIFLSGNGAGYKISTSVESDTPIADQMKHHARTDWVASSIAAGANMGGVVVPFMSEIGGIFMAGYTAKEMNPFTDEEKHGSHKH